MTEGRGARRQPGAPSPRLPRTKENGPNSCVARWRSALGSSRVGAAVGALVGLRVGALVGLAVGGGQVASAMALSMGRTGSDAHVLASAAIFAAAAAPMLAGSCVLHSLTNDGARAAHLRDGARHERTRLSTIHQFCTPHYCCRIGSLAHALTRVPRGAAGRGRTCSRTRRACRSRSPWGLQRAVGWRC